MILIITKENDTHADIVEKHLRAMNEDFVRIDTGWLPNRIQITLRVIQGVTSVAFHQDGKTTDITNPNGIWFRKPSDTQISSALSKETADFVQRECQHLWSYVWEAISSNNWINHPRMNVRANNRVLQWKTAWTLGFKIPDTTVTNSPASVCSVWENRHEEFAVKVLNQTVIEKNGKMYSMYTKLLDAEIMEEIARVELCPIILQPYIKKKREWRVTVVGNKVFSCIINSQSSDRANLDWRRYDMDNVPHLAGDLPKDIENKCLALTKELGLCFGAIDLIEKPTGEFVFLEINPNGQWAWVEALTGLPISHAIAEQLAMKI